MDPQIEIAICEMRKSHPRWGARRIEGELTRKGIEALAPSSIHQALRRNNLVADQAPRRQRTFIRFQRDVANGRAPMMPGSGSTRGVDVNLTDLDILIVDDQEANILKKTADARGLLPDPSDGRVGRRS